MTCPPASARRCGGWCRSPARAAARLGDTGSAVRMHPPPRRPSCRSRSPRAAARLRDRRRHRGAHGDGQPDAVQSDAPSGAGGGCRSREAGNEEGQFALTGTTVAGERSLAFLQGNDRRQVADVKQGDTINGMLVAEVKPDRVKLTLADDSEEIVLKVVDQSASRRRSRRAGAAGGTGAAAGRASRPPRNAQPGAPGARRRRSPSGAAPPARPKRRRAAASRRMRAARPAASAPPIAEPAPAPQPARRRPRRPAQPDPGWSQVYQRYQQRRATSDAAADAPR